MLKKKALGEIITKSWKQRLRAIIYTNSLLEDL